jgi:hypothetical protein
MVLDMRIAVSGNYSMVACNGSIRFSPMGVLLSLGGTSNALQPLGLQEKIDAAETGSH